MKDWIKHTHESYGLLSFGRRTTHPPQQMFGSQVRTGNPIGMTVSTASVNVDGDRQWFFREKNIIEIELTPAQFADAITTLNVGEGVPCTIRWVSGDERIREDPPYESKMETHSNEMKQRVNNAMGDAKRLMENATEILSAKGPLKVSDKGRLQVIMERMMQEICRNLPFIAEELTKVMDEAKSQAKAEIEAFATTAVQRAGLESIKADGLIGYGG